MFNNVTEYINKLSGLFFAIALFLGAMFPTISILFRPYMAFILMAILFIGFIKVNFSILKIEVFKWKYQLYLVVMSLFVVPIINYFIAFILVKLNWICEDFSIATLIVFAAPTAASVPIFCILLKGHLERAVLSVVLTSLLIPITLPLICYLLLGKLIEVNPLKMAIFIFIIVIIPFILSLLVRSYFTKTKQFISNYSSISSITLLFFVIFAGASGLKSQIMQSPWLAVKGLIFALLIYLITFVIGYSLSLKKTTVDKVTAAIVVTWTNVSLGILIIIQFFLQSFPRAILYTLIMSISWSLVILPISMVVTRIYKKDSL